MKKLSIFLVFALMLSVFSSGFCTVNASEPLTLTSNSYLQINRTDKLVYYVSATSKVSELIANFRNSDDIQVMKDGTNLNPDDTVITGCIVKDMGSEDTLTAVVLGDIYGGTSSVANIIGIKKQILSQTSFSKAQLLAADVNQDSSINAQDIMALKKDTLQLSPVSDNPASDFSYTISANKVTITRYKGTATKVNIPSEIEGKPVVIIGSYAFYNSAGLTSITIPSSVASIDQAAILGCTGLTSIKIPNSVTSISVNAIVGCTGLSSIYVDSQNVNYSSLDGVLFNKTRTELITCPAGRAGSYNVPGSVNSIGQYAFSSCISLVSITIPDSVISIGQYVFSYSGITSISIPDSVTYMDQYAFYNCPDLTAVSIPESINRIRFYTFSGCSSLESIVIPGSVTTIENDAFSYSGLTSVTILGSLSYLGNNSFSGCIRLTSFTAMGTITSIGSRVFMGSKNLLWAKFEGNAPASTDSYSFYQVPPRFIIYYTQGKTGWTTPQWNGCNTVSTNPESDFNYSVNGNAVSITGYKGSGLDVSIPLTIEGKPVTSVGDSAFSGLGITSLTVPFSVTAIGESAFSNCQSLTSIAVLGWVASIGDYAFNGCSSLFLAEFESNAPTAFGDRVFDNTAPNFIIYHTPDSTGWAEPVWHDYNTNCYNRANDFRYTFNGSNVTIVRCKITEGTVSIPPMIRGKPVTVIGDNTFHDSHWVTSVTIPNSVTSIGNYAFAGANIFSITIPDSVISIGDRAFYACRNLISVTIPASATNISDYAFYDCGNLLWAKFKGGLKSLGQFVFYYASENFVIYYPEGAEGWTTPKRGLYNTVPYRSEGEFEYMVNAGAVTVTGYSGASRDVIIPSVIDGKPVTEIGYSAFAYSNITSVTIPSSVTSIGNIAFFGCRDLTSITIPASVTYVGSQAFSWCENLASAAILSPDLTFGDYVFANCHKINSVDLGTADSIGNHMFFGCQDLTSIVIPNSVVSIGDFAFSECGLTSVTLPNSVNSIENYIFAGCSGLTSVVIPNSVISIGNYAFAGCGFTSITLPDSLTSIGNNAFSACESLTSIVIPGQVGSLGESAFSYCPVLASITIPDSVTSIGNSAFAGCIALTSVTIPDSVTFMGNSAFSNCENLVYVTLGSITSVGNSAFLGCKNLTSIDIPDSVTSIGSQAFYNCAGLTSVIIPDLVTHIGDFAFINCTGLTTITIPSLVTGIGNSVFGSCHNLISAKFEGNAPTYFGAAVFNNTDNNFKIYFHEGKSGWTSPTWKTYPTAKW